MAVRHGIYRKLHSNDASSTDATGAVFRYGIRGVFYELAQGDIPGTKNISEHARQIDQHFVEMCNRFLFAQQELSTCLVNAARVFHDHGGIRLPTNHLQRAECFADQTLSCLGVIIDDVAILIAIANGLKPVDSMTALLKKKNLEALRYVKSHLDELSQTDSWWSLGFLFKKGLRQLLIHNHHCIKFQTSTGPNQLPKIDAYLLSPHSNEKGIVFCDYFSTLRTILAKLFDWLDRLESSLRDHLGIPLGKNIESSVPRILLPLGYELGITEFSEPYFSIPTCDESDYLPWTVEVKARAGERIISSY